MKDNTKNLLQEALIRTMKTKSLDKITIVDLSKSCHINRQTFYYHFNSIYDLIEWIYEKELFNAIGKNHTYDNWQIGLLNAMNFVYNEKTFILNTYHSTSHEFFERLLKKTTYFFIESVLDCLPSVQFLSYDEKDFIICFYKHAITGIILNWISGGLKTSPQHILDKFIVLVDGHLMLAVNRFNEKKYLF